MVSVFRFCQSNCLRYVIRSQSPNFLTEPACRKGVCEIFQVFVYIFDHVPKRKVEQNMLKSILNPLNLKKLNFEFMHRPMRPSVIDSLSLKSFPASHAKLMAQMETPTSTATAMLVCFDKIVTTLQLTGSWRMAVRDVTKFFQKNIHKYYGYHMFSWHITISHQEMIRRSIGGGVICFDNQGTKTTKASIRGTFTLVWSNMIYGLDIWFVLILYWYQVDIIDVTLVLSNL